MMVDIFEIIILIGVLFGLQKYLSSLDNNLLGLITPIIFTLYILAKVFIFNSVDSDYWWKIFIGNFILLLDFYIGNKDRDKRQQKELEKMKIKDY